MYFPIFITNKNDIDPITEQQLWFKVLNFYPQLNIKYRNPLRKDNNPGMYFVSMSGLLFMVDWGDPDFKYKNIIEIFKKVYNTTYYGAIYEINKVLNKNTTVPTNRIYSVCRSNSSSTSVHATKYITVEESDDKDLISYYKQYKVSRISPNIIPISSYTTTFIYPEKTFRRTYRPSKIAMAYLYPSGNKKIYCPYESIKYKWKSDANKNDVYENNLDTKSDTIIITKSFKDVDVLNNLGYHSIGFHNEGSIPDKDIIDKYLENYKYIYILYDNDDAGIKSSKKLKSKLDEYGYSATTVFLKEYKDISDMIYDKPVSFVKNILNNIIC